MTRAYFCTLQTDMLLIHDEFSAYTQGGCSLHAIRDVEEHSIRRRYWEKGMSGPAISL